MQLRKDVGVNAKRKKKKKEIHEGKRKFFKFNILPVLPF